MVGLRPLVHVLPRVLRRSGGHVRGPGRGRSVTGARRNPGLPDDDARRGTADPRLSTLLPATTLFTEPQRNDALVAATRPVTVTEPCPGSSGGPAGSDAMFAEMSRVEPMLGVVLQYGGQHPEQFGSYGLVWHDVNDASVFISFTADLDVHREVLRALVSYPDELIVCQVAVSGDVAQALAAQLVDELEGRYQSVGVGMNGVEVVLMPGEEALAADLAEEYGGALTVTAGSPADVAMPQLPAEG